jgi:hypothetical protein
VLDGILAHTAGGRRIVYPRFAHPSRTAAPLRAVGYGTEGHVLEQVAAPFAPKIIYSNSSYEYWGATASLLHTTADGERDVPLPEGTRIYMLSGGQHGPAAFPPTHGRAVHLQNPNDYRPIVRALLERLREWVENGKQPAPSRYPRLGDGTLVATAQLKRVEGIVLPQEALQPFGKPGTALVPQVDEEGNDLGGVRTPDVAVPLAVYSGWNLRSAQIGQPGALIGNSGSFLPFSQEKAAKRYVSVEGYLRQWDREAQALAADGLLLPEDIPSMRQSARAKWEWIQMRSTNTPRPIVVNNVLR